MNRRDLQRLAQLRLDDARVLLENQRFESAYYLCGYVVECALKACIARATREGDFPMKNSHHVYIHDLEKLLGFVDPALAKELHDLKSALADNWSTVTLWREESPYDERPEVDARALYNATADPKDGVFQCIKEFW